MPDDTEANRDSGVPIAVVVGGSSGIGKATARMLANDGDMVALVARSKPRLDSAASDIFGKINTFAGDASFPSGVVDISQSLKERYSHVDYLVLSSGLFETCSITSLSEDHWDDVMNNNLKGPVFLVKSLLPLLKKGKGKSIVFVSSILAHVGAPNCLSYCAAKGGLSSVVRALASELAPLRIRVNSVSPGHVDTPMIRSLIRSNDEASKIAAQYPLQRLGEPDDIAGLIVFLLKKQSSWITGVDYLVDGGRTSVG
jgi:NAD(P)-dependent dehydrogenase (short-subunit alcohol dehydrogenase family)